MSLEVEATYENGVLKLDKPLPLNEHERVTIEIKPKMSLSRRMAGSIGWTGTREDLRRIAEDPEFSIYESVEFLRESHEDMEAGRTMPAIEALEELAKKHGLTAK